jgi:pyruvate formate lyase activating enzyme
MTDVSRTTARQLVQAAEIGAAAGLRFVYAGNAPGQVGEWEHTRCPECQTTLIERHGYFVESYRLTPEGRCPGCGAMIPGIWHPGGAADVPVNMDFPRLPKRVQL